MKYCVLVVKTFLFHTDIKCMYNHLVHISYIFCIKYEHTTKETFRHEIKDDVANVTRIMCIYNYETMFASVMKTWLWKFHGHDKTKSHKTSQTFPKPRISGLLGLSFKKNPLHALPSYVHRKVLITVSSLRLK